MTSAAPSNDDVSFKVVEVGSVLFELPGPSPQVTLVEAAAPFRSFALAIALPEAQALALALQKTPGIRPSTHELFTSFLSRVQGDVIAVRIVKHDAGVFYGEIDIMMPTGRVTLDCRPSDGIILAQRQAVPAPLLCAEGILDELN